MRLARCEKGHYYDKDKFSTCPHCNDMQVAPSETVAFEDPEAKKEQDVVVPETPEMPKVEVEERVLFSAATPVDEENNAIEDDFAISSPSVTEDDLDEMVTIRLSEQDAVVSAAVAGVEDTVMFKEDEVTEEEPMAENNSVAEELAIEERPIMEETSTLVEEPVREEILTAEEKPIAEEPIIEETPVAVEEPIREEFSMSAEEPVIEDTPIKEEKSIIEDTSVAEEPIREETLVLEEEPVREEVSMPEEEPVREEVSMPEEEPVREEVSMPEEEPVREEVSMPEEEPVKEEFSMPAKEPVIEDTPIMEEKSIIEDTLAAEDPMKEEIPIKEERPVTEESLAIEEDTSMEQSVAATAEEDKEDTDESPQQTLADAVPNRIPDDAILEDMNSNPVIGWLVSIEGIHKGKSYNVKQGRNFVGRSTAMDICLSGNSKISRDRHAIITYDPRTKKCYLQPDESRDLVYINEDLLFGPMPMKHNDVITMGEEQFVFLTLQCDKADWI